MGQTRDGVQVVSIPSHALIINCERCRVFKLNRVCTSIEIEGLVLSYLAMYSEQKVKQGRIRPLVIILIGSRYPSKAALVAWKTSLSFITRNTHRIPYGPYRLVHLRLDDPSYKFPQMWPQL